MRKHRSLNHRPARLWTTLLMLLSMVLLPLAVPATPALAAGVLTIEPIAAYNFVVDSNVESPSTYAPEAGTLAARVCNTGDADLTDVQIFIGNYTGTLAGSTPGIYPSVTNPSTGQVGTFSLVHEGGSAGTNDATRFLPRLAPGECAMQYWLVSYPRLDANGNSVTGGIKPDDDLVLQYDMWANAGNTGQTVDVTRSVTMRNEISAAANKIWPNTTSKVPDEYLTAIATLLGWDTLTPSGSTVAYPGQTVTTQGIWYDLGNVGFGFDNNNDGVPDQNAWLQPIGDPNSYDPGCFRLVRSYGILIVKLKSGGEQLIPFVDQLYFESIPENTGVVGLVYYQYAALDGSCTAGLSPYQEVASGYDNEKFSGDYGFGIPPLQSRTPAVNFVKGVNNTSIPASPASTLTYTIAMTNSASEPSGFEVTVGDPDLGIPLVITDKIPSGTDYVANSATAVGAIVSPGGVQVASIRYSTDNRATWSIIPPAANTVTDIQWWMDRGVPQGDTVTVQFQATAPVAPPDVSTIAVIPNTAEASFGTAPPFAESTVTTLVQGPNSLSGNIFRDNGAGGLFGNSIYDSANGEILLPNVTVDLYRDSNNNGVIDAGETLIATTAATYSGAYSFGSLPDGNYITQVNINDSDIPTGWTNTTPKIRTAALDPTNAAGATPVTVTGLNFGFAPALTLDKQLISPTSPLYEGELVTFEIDVANELPGSGGPSAACTYVIPASIAHEDATLTPPGGNSANGRWLNTANALGLPDGLFSQTNMNNNDDTLGLSGFNLGNQGGTIISVQYRLYVRETLNFIGSDALEVQVYYNDAGLGGLDVYNTANVFSGPTGTDYVITSDITSDRLGLWAWSDFVNNLMEMQLIGNRAGGSSGEIALDSAQYIVTTNQTCGNDDTILNPVPLTDTYDPARLQFVSASPGVDSSAPAGTLTWSNIGPLYPGQIKTVQATFRVLTPTSQDQATNNTATITTATFANGRPANTATDTVPLNVRFDGSIAGRVFRDVATFGWQDPTTGYTGSDTGFPGVTVELYGCVNSVTGVLYTTTTAASGSQCTAQTNGAWRLLASRVTDTNGDYIFTGLRDGFYVVQVADGSPVLVGGTATSTLPTGVAQTAEANDNQTVGGFGGNPCGAACNGLWGNNTANLNTTTFNPINTANEAITNVNFGYNITTARIYGTVWEDVNANGVINTTDGEGFLSGITVYLCVSTDTRPCTAANADFTTTTGASGYYRFDVPAGTYFIGTNTATLPAGATWTNTADPGVGPNDSTSDNITVVAGGVNGSNDFGYQRSGAFSIGDTLYYDWDGDATQDVGVDEGMPNITVSLYEDTNGNGIIDSGVDALISTQVTGPNGTYSFTNLAPGNYLVVVNTGDPDFPAGRVRQSGDPDEIGTCTICDSRSTETISAASITTADFGYQPNGAYDIGDTVWFDRNGDGVQSGVQEIGLANVSVSLQVDLNGDGTFVTVRSDVTDADGKYLFENLPPGNYRVVVNSADTDIPDDPFGNPYAPTTPTTRNITITNADVLTADFGFSTLAAIGDTVYYDTNNNGQQDYGEPGIAGVTVTITNVDPFTAPDGTVYAAGTYSDTAITDANGKYLFSGLPAIPTSGSGVRYTVSVASGAGTPINGQPQTADPDRDGVTCDVNINAPEADPYSACNNATTQRLYPGSNFMGADFGYLPTGVLGDTLWIDANNDGVRDSNEYGIPYVTVSITGPGCAPCTTETDANGEYSFAGLADGSYTVTVNTADPDFVALGPIVGSYEPNGTLNNSITVTMAGGVITQVDGTGTPNLGIPGTPTTCTAAGTCSLVADFGFRYFDAAGFDISGTICLDGAGLNGLCDVDTSGVAADEVAYPNQTIWLYRWSDDGDGILESGETVLAGVTTTDINGDYSFLDLPQATGNNRYIVSLAAPGTNLDMTTSGAGVVENSSGGVTQSAYRFFNLTANVTNQDFAFTTTLAYDFGDLADDYSTTLQGSPDGARHSIPSGGSSVYLGTTPPDGEINGAPTTNATGDDVAGSADEDGVVVPAPRWANGPDGGSLNITVNGSGWLVAWIDFNNDGDFADANEMVISQAVSSGTANYLIDVPADLFPGGIGPNISLSARFRVFTSQPTIPTLAFSGAASDGEVEDYQLNFTTNSVTLTAFSATSGADGLVTIRWATAGELDVLGFQVLRSDNGDRASAEAIHSDMIAAEGDAVSGARYSLNDPLAPTSGTRYWLVVVNANGVNDEYGPIVVTPQLDNAGLRIYLPIINR